MLEATASGRGKLSGNYVDIAIFAHNESKKIAKFISDLGAQSIFPDGRHDVRAWIMMNGCTDDTEERAKEALAKLPPEAAERVTLVSLDKGGKSRTWNVFVHQTARPEAEVFIFADADIELPSRHTFDAMVTQLAQRPDLEVFVSRPVKDVTHHQLRLGLVPWLISQGAGSLDDYRTSISGQLYAVRSTKARDISLPVGLPVEDGFLRAMILTDLLSMPEQVSRIDGDPQIFHVYESIRGIGALVRHQTRIVTGSAINAALFAVIRRDAPTFDKAKAVLDAAGRDEEWLKRTLCAELPKPPHGYVPFSFLYKRLGLLGRSGEKLSVKKLLMLPVGLALDFTAYALSTFKLMRGQGAGYW